MGCVVCAAIEGIGAVEWLDKHVDAYQDTESSIAGEGLPIPRSCPIRGLGVSNELANEVRDEAQDERRSKDS